MYRRHIFQNINKIGVRFFSERDDYSGKSVTVTLLAKRGDENIGKSIFSVGQRGALIDFCKHSIKDGVFREIDAKPDKNVKEEENHYVDWVRGNYRPELFSRQDLLKVNIEVMASKHIDFSCIDERIQHDGRWRETFPLQATIFLPKKYAREIIEKLRKHSNLSAISGESTADFDPDLRHLYFSSK